MRIVDDVTGFDAGYFGIDECEARRMHPVQRILLEVVHEAVEDAGIPLDELAGSRTAVFVSALLTNEHWDEMNSSSEPQLNDGLDSASLGGTAGRIARTFDLRGPTMAVDGTCAGGLLAVHLAAQSVRADECDVAVVAGAHLLTRADMALAMTQILSSDGECRFADAAGSGVGRAEGAAALLLAPIDRAQRRREPVSAMVMGSAITANGAAGRTMASPSARAQEEAVRRAHAVGGTAPGEVDYVEAHGTGTAAGDRIEITGLARTVGSDRPSGRPCLVGSVKSHIGHTEPVAGIVGTIAAAISLRDERIAATRHVASVHPAFAATPNSLAPALSMVAWPRRADRRRMAGVSSIGGSGVNAHLVLADGPLPPADVDRDREHEVFALPLSARTGGALAELARRYLDHLRAGDDRDRIHDVCFSAAVHRSHREHRAVVVARSVAELRAGLENVVSGERDARVHHGAAAGTPPLTVAVFGEAGTAGADLLAVSAYRTYRRQCLTELDRWDRPETRARSIRTRHWAHQVAVAKTLLGWGMRFDAIRAEGVGRLAADVITNDLTLGTAAGAVSDGIDSGGFGLPRAWPRISRNDQPELVLDIGHGHGDEEVQLHEHAARAWVAGHRVRWDTILEGGRYVRVPHYPWQRQDLGPGTGTTGANEIVLGPAVAYEPAVQVSVPLGRSRGRTAVGG